MTSNIILECSQKDATNSVSNSNWVSTFQSDQTIETGDTLRMKQCLINTQAINSQNIVLDKEQNVTISFCVYEEAIPLVQGVPFATEGISRSGTSPADTTNENAYRQSFQGPDDTLTDSVINTSPLNGTGDKSTLQNEVDGIYILREQEVAQTLTSKAVTVPITFTIPAASYSPDELAGFITTHIDDKMTIRNRPDTGKAGVFVTVLKNPPTATPAPNIYSPGQAIIKDGNTQVGKSEKIVGASNVLLEYKGTGFQWSYLHTPIFTEMTKGPSGSFTTYSNPGVLLTGTELEENVRGRYGGVMLTALQPSNFWNQLGFSDSQIADITYDDATFQSLEDGVRQAYIRDRTTGVKPNSAYRRTDLLSTPFSNPYASSPIATSDIKPIAAKLPYQVDNIGFYRIEAITALSNEYNTPNERKSKVTAVVSKNYNTNDFITGYGGDSSLDYEHMGETTVLNNIQIRIVDPLSEKEVENLGPNSTVFMELVKAPPQQKSNVKHK